MNLILNIMSLHSWLGTQVAMSRVDGSLWLVFWSNLAARDINLRSNFIRIFSKDIEVIH